MCVIILCCLKKIQKHFLLNLFFVLFFCSITLDELNVQKSSIFSNLQTGLNLVLTNVSLNISTNLALSLGSLYYIRSFIKDSLVTASMTISTTGLSLHLAVIVNRDEQGQPVFNVTNCSFYAGDYHIKFGGEQGWVCLLE